MYNNYTEIALIPDLFPLYEKNKYITITRKHLKLKVNFILHVVKISTLYKPNWFKYKNFESFKHLVMLRGAIFCRSDLPKEMSKNIYLGYSIP
jgi:hypothetical protein